jgi:GntR family transcriptional regulator / MocR family aminotransferase
MLLQLGAERPLYRAVTVALREAILAGRLVPGSRLPGTRALARELGVSRIVVLAAFEQLAAEGYILSASGSGSRVAPAAARPRTEPAVARADAAAQVSGYASRAVALMPHVPAPAATVDAVAIDFRYTTFVPEERTQRAWAHEITRAAAAAEFEYPDPAGVEALRREICAHLRRHRGIDAMPENVLVVTGSQQALDLAARVICDPGDRIGIEDPCYQGARQSFLAAGARLVPCAVDAEGFDVERNAERLDGARAVYVTPSHQHPTGAIMSLERRLKLLAWASRQGAWVIEDDYDSELHYGSGTIPALGALDNAGRIVYIGTVARTLSPELRLGYTVVPPALRETFCAVKWLADRGTSPLEQRALAAIMASGTYERAQRRMARSLAQRRHRLVGALQAHFEGTGLRWSGAGAHVFLQFPNLNADDVEGLLAEGVRRGVRLYSASPYYLLPPECGGIVCGYATLTGDEIESGLERFAAAYRAVALTG